MLGGCDAEGGWCSWGVGVWSWPVASMLATMPAPNCRTGAASPVAAEVVTAGAVGRGPGGLRLVLRALPCTVLRTSSFDDTGGTRCLEETTREDRNLEWESLSQSMAGANTDVLKG